MLSEPTVISDQDRQITAAVRREGRRLRSFIRQRVLDTAEAEDILQEVLYELVSAYRLLQPIEQVGAWLLRVARNRIIDRFRRKSLAPPVAGSTQDEDAGEAMLEEWLTEVAPGPEGEAMRQMLLEQIEEALEELPREQREVFVAHELEGASYRELSQRWGVNVNTLLARKRYAITAMRERLQAVYEEWLED
ncbi:MAG TPA: sigma-70 family RNA polymerase sigma factor [Steroidobacteraceae bacterium]